ncbi:MAG: hypothetical protein IPM64_17350 [Phycisphaerales bacterium]|nr:hypothetical protein [Phycisphaerales bacterium]
MSQLHVIEGRVTLPAAAMVAIVHGRKLGTIDIAENTHTTARLIVRRSEWPRDRAEVVEYTIDDASVAGLVGPGRRGRTAKRNWEENPRAMLLARARSRACTMHFPDVFLGIATPEELGSDDPDQPVIDVPFEPAGGSLDRCGITLASEAIADAPVPSVSPAPSTLAVSSMSPTSPVAPSSPAAPASAAPVAEDASAIIASIRGRAAALGFVPNNRDAWTACLAHFGCDSLAAMSERGTTALRLLDSHLRTIESLRRMRGHANLSDAEWLAALQRRGESSELTLSPVAAAEMLERLESRISPFAGAKPDDATRAAMSATSGEIAEPPLGKVLKGEGSTEIDPPAGSSQ